MPLMPFKVLPRQDITIPELAELAELGACDTGYWMIVVDTGWPDRAMMNQRQGLQ
jgi:hypothetical protein